MVTSLPIEEIRKPLMKAIRAGKRRIVIEAPTGSGKSTQIPQMVLEYRDWETDRKSTRLNSSH